MAKCAKGIAKICFSTGQKLTHAAANDETRTQHRTPLSYNHHWLHQPLKAAEHSRTQFPPGLLTLSPARSTRWYL